MRVLRLVTRTGNLIRACSGANLYAGVREPWNAHFHESHHLPGMCTFGFRTRTRAIAGHAVSARLFGTLYLDVYTTVIRPF